MGIIRYKIKNDQIVASRNSAHNHPIDSTYRRPNQAWAALRNYYGLSTEQLKAHGWRVKLDVDEKKLAIEAANVAIEQAPMPGLMRRVLASVFGSRG